MKRDLSIILSVLMIFSLCTKNMKADDTEDIDEDLINEWTLTVESLNDIYLEDLSDVELLKSDIEKDNDELKLASDEFLNSQNKLASIKETYDKALNDKNEVDNKVSLKEAEVKELEDTLISSELIEANNKLEELKQAEEDAFNKSIALAPKSNSDVIILKDEYETSLLNVANCEYQLKEANKNLIELEAFGEDFAAIAKSEVEKWTTKLEEANKELETRKKAYEDAVKLGEDAQKALDEWTKANEALKAQEEVVANLENQLAKDNESLTAIKDELYALQFDQAIKEDAYIKAKVTYDDLNTEVKEAQILVDSLKEDIDAKEELLKSCNEDLKVSKEAYENAKEYLANIKAIYNTKNAKIEVKQADVDDSIKETLSPKVNNTVIKPTTFTSEELKAIEEGKEVSVTLSISSIDDSLNSKTIDSNEQLKLIDTTIKEDNLGLAMIMDISLISKIEDSTSERKITNTSEEVSITINIPNEYIDETVNRIYKVIRIHDNGDSLEKTTIDGEFNKETNEFTFKTNKFSTYALVFEDKIKQETKVDDNKKTTDDTSSNIDKKESNTNIQENTKSNDNTNYVWSNNRNEYVYVVTNTSSK